jgi:hypothetical protein
MTWANAVKIEIRGKVPLGAFPGVPEPDGPLVHQNAVGVHVLEEKVIGRLLAVHLQPHLRPEGSRISTNSFDSA